MSVTASDTVTTVAVEFRQRLRALALGTLVATLVVTLVVTGSGGELVDPAGSRLLVGVAVGHLVCNVALLFARWMPTRMLRWSLEVASAVGVLVVVVLLGVTGGVVSPFAPLMHLHAVVITLLFGVRAGIRAASLLSLAGVWLLSSGPGVLAGVAADAAARVPILESALAPGLRVAVLVGGVWSAVLIVSQLSRLTEFEMRRWLDDLELLRDVTRELDPRNGLGNACDSLARTVLSAGDYCHAVVWMRGEGADLTPAGAASRSRPARPELGAWHLDGRAEPFVSASADPFPHLVRRSDPRPEGLLEAHGPRAPLVVVPLKFDGTLLGVLSATVAAPALGAPHLHAKDLRRLHMVAKEASLLLDNARLQAELESLAVTDMLTGLPNHGFFQQRLSEEAARVERRAKDSQLRPLSVAMIDLDHFKHVNDTYGHPTGDIVLAAVGRTIASALRGEDVACRYGGEEFGVVFSETAAPGAIRACERVRDAIDRLELTTEDGQPLKVTASFGVATVIGGDVDRAGLVAATDRALYAAKHAGRNCIVHADALDDALA